MNTVQYTTEKNDIIQLKPNYNIPLILVFVSIPLAFIQLWLGFVIALFGSFLMFQAVMIRLQFTSTALDIYRGNKLLRRFPYVEWENWQIFWQPIPILLYFKEVKSIHFLPIIFDAKTLKECLEKYCPQK